MDFQIWKQRKVKYVCIRCLNSMMIREDVSTLSEIDYFLVLNTDTMVWDKGKYVGTPPLTRYGHTTTSIGPHLLIFGN